METERTNPVSEQDVLDESDIRVKKYLRGNTANLEGLRDKKLKGQLSVREKYYGISARAAANAEKWLGPSEGGFLEPEGLEKTQNIKQESIVREVDLASSRKPFDMILPELGPYKIDYTSSGRYMLVGGRKGHLAMMDMLTMDLIKEFQVRETVRDVTFLHNDQFFAVAQKKYPYIYNRHGTEIHCLREHGKTLKLEFLEKYFLLVSANNHSQLRYQDTTTGQIVANHRTSLGPTHILRSNPYNSVISLGHSSGRVTFWKPTSPNPLITMLCHRGPVTALAFHPNGHLMATAGMDRKIKIWDLRKYEAVNAFSGHAQTLDFSQKGLLALANGSRVQIWRDVGSRDFEIYMNHNMVKGYQVGQVLFRPYEDLLGLGHSMGLSSILVPGSGEPNFDTWVANPYETAKQRREKEVHALLDKLQPETIMLDPGRIGAVRSARRREKVSKEGGEEEMEAAIGEAKIVEFKKKSKGRNKPSKRSKRKQEEIFRAKKPFLEMERRESEQRPEKIQRVGDGAEDLPKTLQRFVKKRPV